MCGTVVTIDHYLQRVGVGILVGIMVTHNSLHGFRRTLRYRRTGRSLPLSPTASASRSEFLTRLNTRPAPSPVNASTSPLQATPHDSGSVWVASSLPYDFCIHYTSPV